MIPILILAAGQSSRMLGRDKLLEEINGTPVLRLLAGRALRLGPVFVTLPKLDHLRGTILPDEVQKVAVPDAAHGMSRSLRAGIAALPDTTNGVLILPGDMPDITFDDLSLLLRRASQSSALIQRATTHDGKPGHPIYFNRSLFPLFETLTGDRGAFQICADHAAQTEFVPLNGQRARLDLDTPEDWNRYRNVSKR